MRDLHMDQHPIIGDLHGIGSISMPSAGEMDTTCFTEPATEQLQLDAFSRGCGCRCHRRHAGTLADTDHS